MVERRTELLRFEESPERCARIAAPARWKRGDVRARYIAGCDGARSVVRETLEARLSRRHYNHLFYVADVKASGPAMNGELHVGLDAADFLAVFPLKDDGHARLVGTVRDEPSTADDDLSLERREQPRDRADAALKSTR